jgi:hypothetical protein
MKIRNIVFGVFGLGLSIFAQAGTVSIQSLTDAAGGTTSPGEGMILSLAGTPLTSGFASGGYFSISDEEVLTAITNQNFSLLANSFVVVASDNFASGVTAVFEVPSIPGFYAANPVSYGAPEGGLLGKSLYTFIGDGASLLDSSGFVLYKNIDVINADLPVADGNSLVLANGTLLIGTQGTGTYDASSLGGAENTSVSTFRLVAAIPEPSTMLLGAIGALGLLRRRR